MENEKQEIEKTNITKKSMREASLQEIGDHLGLTRMRICQIEKAIMKKIRESQSLDEFNG